MIEIKFTLDPNKSVYDQLLDHVAAFFPQDIVIAADDDGEPVTRVTPRKQLSPPRKKWRPSPCP